MCLKSQSKFELVAEMSRKREGEEKARRESVRAGRAKESRRRKLKINRANVLSQGEKLHDNGSHYHTEFYGRFFTTDDDEAQTPRSVVISSETDPHR